jgi:hypothetical protein
MASHCTPGKLIAVSMQRRPTRRSMEIVMGNCIPVTVVAAAIVAMLVFAAAAGETGNPVEGHRLAIRICTFCHVVASYQEFAPALHKPAPSFQAISNERGTTSESCINSYPRRI